MFTDSDNLFAETYFNYCYTDMKKEDLPNAQNNLGWGQEDFSSATVKQNTA